MCNNIREKIKESKMKAFNELQLYGIFSYFLSFL